MIINTRHVDHKFDNYLDCLLDNKQTSWYYHSYVQYRRPNVIASHVTYMHKHNGTTWSPELMAYLLFRHGRGDAMSVVMTSAGYRDKTPRLTDLGYLQLKELVETFQKSIVIYEKEKDFPKAASILKQTRARDRLLNAKVGTLHRTIAWLMKKLLNHPSVAMAFYEDHPR